MARRSYGVDTKRESFLLGMFNLAMTLAPTMAGPYDVAWLSHILHSNGWQDCERLLASNDGRSYSEVEIREML